MRPDQAPIADHVPVDREQSDDRPWIIIGYGFVAAITAIVSVIATLAVVGRLS